MKIARNLEEFYKLNDQDVNKLLHKHFKNILNRFSIEDIKNEIYERLMSKKYIENYRPFKIYIDEKNSIWEFKVAEAKFSTYIFTFMKNYILAYYGNKKNYEDWLSLDEYSDRGFGKNEKGTLRKIKIPQESYNLENLDFKLDIEDLLSKLEEKTKNKGTIICENDFDLGIAKFIDSFGSKGCKEQHLIDKLFENKNIDQDSAIKSINNLKNNGVIKFKLDIDNKKIYYLDEPLRRSLYNLFKYYLEGYKDKEISEKFNMTVAGVGALKRTLRKEIFDLSKDFKEN